jgi:tetratricopeptide (TPR) repeat protein
MAQTRYGIAVALLAGLATLTAPASASDDNSKPLYVIINGKRVPTVIVPPTQATAQPAVLEVIQPPPAADDSDSVLESEEGLEPPADPNAAPPPQNDRRYVVGHYAGYPVSIPCWQQADWVYSPYMPPDYYGKVIVETYRAQRYVRNLEEGSRFNAWDMQQRATRVLASHDKAMRVGLLKLKGGDYAQAVIALEMAAELNQGDPACRIHLAQARMAQGHYTEAGKVLRRALQLQPKLLYVTLKLAAYYGDAHEFDKHVDALAEHLKTQRAGADAWFLLGYMEFQRGNLDQAYAAFREVARFIPKDSLTTKYLKITRPATK